MKAKKTQSRWKKKGTTAKIIELPNDTLSELDKLAAADRNKTKPYMEKVLINHAKK